MYVAVQSRMEVVYTDSNPFRNTLQFSNLPKPNAQISGVSGESQEATITRLKLGENRNMFENLGQDGEEGGCIRLTSSGIIGNMNIERQAYVLDGKKFSTLEEFFEHVSQQLIPKADWGKNLDAFNDILRGGFGTPEGGFVLRWKNSEISKENLGFPETIRWLQQKLTKCHPTNVSYIENDIQDARRGKGKTLFDIIIEIIHDHAPNGTESEDGVELILE